MASEHEPNSNSTEADMSEDSKAYFQKAQMSESPYASDDEDYYEDLDHDSDSSKDSYKYFEECSMRDLLKKYREAKEKEGPLTLHDGVSSKDGRFDTQGIDMACEESNDSASLDDDCEMFDRDDIAKMLDEGIDFENVKSASLSNPNIRTREGLEKLKTNHFEMLPQDWIELTHHTGITVYLHRSTRVVSLSRPYLLGNQKYKRHNVPTSAIPCFAYRKQLDELEEKEKNKVQIQDNDIESAILTSAKVESVDENTENNALSSEEIMSYCKKRFSFETVYVAPKHKKTEGEKNSQRPSLPPGSILISIPVFDNNTKTMKTRDWPLNPNGKTAVCVLHEYLQQALKKGPSYEYKEIPSKDTPYQATLKINNVVYGVGCSTSKKQAKLEAARLTLEILIPKLKNFDFQMGSKTSGNGKRHDKYSIFDTLQITDPRVAECCAKSTEPSPYTMLLTCLERNYGIGDQMQVSYVSSHTKHNRILFSMTAGEYSTSVPCKNKKEGKQLASQKILQELHPSIQCWGSLLRLYGNASTNNARSKKVREQEITRLQSKALINQPNWDILNKLNAELDRKADEQEKTLQTRGSFQVPDNIELPLSSICDANLNV